MIIHPLRFVDRSRTTTDWTCPRKRFYNYDFNGRGIVKDELALELFLGIAAHDAIASIALDHQLGSVNIDVIATTIQKQVFEALSAGEDSFEANQFAVEQAALMEGLIRGYYRHVWPRLLRQYPNIIAVEQETLFSISDRLKFMCKADLLLGDTEGESHYIEFKTTSSKSDPWINQWNTAVQLHSTVKAIEQTLGQAPLDVTVIGLYKGFVSYGKQNSPLIYCYMKGGNPPFSKGEIRYEYAAGFKRTPVWTLPGGVKKWVEEMPENILNDQFPMTPPIFVNDDLVKDFFDQRETREKEIELALGLMDGAEPDETKPIMNVAFPQRFDQCDPGFGQKRRPCDFKILCHGHVEDPLSQGYKYRVPHHLPELEQFNE